MSLPCDHKRPKLTLPGYTPPRLPFNAPTFIPTSSPADMARAILEAFRGINAALQQVGQRRTVVPLIEDIEAREGQIITGVANGQVIKLPEAVQDGAIGQVTILLSDVSSPATVVHPDGSTTLLDQPGIYEIALAPESTNWQTAPGVGSGGAASGAQYLVGAAHGSLPNARVATDSAEIDAVLTTPNVVSWALNAASVAFGKLANLTGLSVLGRAASSTGVMAAITAVTPRHVLRNNSVASTLEWGFPTLVSDDGGTAFENVQIDFQSSPSVLATATNLGGGVASASFQRAALTGDVTASANSNATTIANDAVTNAKLANMASPRLKGRTTALSGDPEDLNLTNSTSVSWNTATGGSISVERAALTGAISASANGNATLFAGILDNGAAENDRTNLNFIAGTNTTATVTDDAANDELEVRFNVDDFPLSGLADQAANTFVINATASPAPPTAVAGTTVAGAGLTYTTGGILAVGAGTHITVNPDDVTINLTTLVAAIDSTSVVQNGTTLERAALTGDVTSAQNSNATTIANDAVTNAKAANVPSPSLKGRTTAAAGDPEDLTLVNSTTNSWNTATGGSVSLERAALTGDITAPANSNTTAIAAGVIVDADVNAAAAIAQTKTGALTGDVTKASGSSATVISAGAVTLAMQANLAQSTMIGRAEGAGTGVPQALTPTQIAAIIDGEAITWSALQTFNGSVIWNNDQVESGALPMNITLGDSVNKLFINTAGDGEIQTIGGTSTAGRIVKVYILTTGSKTFKHGVGVGAQRMFWPDNRDHILGLRQSFELVGENAGTGWRVTTVPTEYTAQSRFIARAEGAGTGVPTAITPTQAVAIIDAESPTWTGAHTFTGPVLGAGSFSTTLAATTSNLAIGAVNCVRITLTGSQTLTGMVPTADGQWVFIENVDTTDGLTLANDATSTAANRFFCPVGQDFFVGAQAGVWARYDGTLQRWILAYTKAFGGFNVRNGVSFITGNSTFEVIGGTGITIGTSSSGTAPTVETDITWSVDQAANFTWTGTNLLGEKSSSPTVGAGNGMYWVQNTTPSKAVFTDDVEADWDVGYAAVTVITANAAATNATTNLSCGTFNIPAGTLRVGSAYRLTGYFAFTHTAAFTPTLTAEVLINGAVVETVVSDVVNVVQTFRGQITAYIVCRTTGAGGTVMVDLGFEHNGSTSIGNALNGSNGTATDAIDTTVSRSIELRIRMTTAVASNTLTVTRGIIERLA